MAGDRECSDTNPPDTFPGVQFLAQAPPSPQPLATQFLVQTSRSQHTRATPGITPRAFLCTFFPTLQSLLLLPFSAPEVFFSSHPHQQAASAGVLLLLSRHFLSLFLTPWMATPLQAKFLLSSLAEDPLQAVIWLGPLCFHLSIQTLLEQPRPRLTACQVLLWLQPSSLLLLRGRDFRVTSQQQAWHLATACVTGGSPSSN